MNPNVSVQATEPLPSAASATCPACGKGTEPQWTYCPHCNERLRRTRRPVAPAKAELDAEARSDGRGTGIGLACFLPVVFAGIILFFVVGGPQLTGASPEGGFILLATVGVVAALVVGFIALMTRTQSRESKVLYGLLGGLSVAVVVVVGGAFLVVAAIAASCANCGKMFR
jgi:hypothetical protein